MKSETCFIASLAVILCVIQVTLAKAKAKSSAANHPIRPPYPDPAYFPQPQHHFPHFPYPQPPTYHPYPYPPHPQPRPPTYPPYPPHPQPRPPTYPPYPPHPQPRPPTYPPYPPHPQPQPPPHPKKPSCNLCTEVKDGLEEILDTLQMIEDQVTPTNDCQSDFVSLTGEASNSPTSPSEATCPADFDVIDCRCDVENNDCDGTTVTGKTCSATKAASGGGIRAQVTCVPSCAGTFTYKTSPSDGTFAQNPQVACDPGTEIVSCWALDRTSIFVGTDIDVAMNRCTAARDCGDPNSAEGCQVQIVCQASTP